MIKSGLTILQLNKILKIWQKKLRLENWQLSIEITYFKRKDYQQSGDIKVNVKNKKAVILLTNKPFRNEEAVIVHELVHLLLWDYDHFCEKEFLKTNDRLKGRHGKYMNKLEKTVDIFTKILLKTK